MNEPPRLTQRIYSIDILRGLIMILMALDHVRDYFHITAATDSPTNLATTTPALFFTRWITHFCAPIFIFLAGLSAYLAGQRKTIRERGNFLMRRGLWLVLIEVTVVTLGWTFDPFYHVLILQVIWSIAISMIFLGILVRLLPARTILFIGLAIVLFHNLLDYPEARLGGRVGILWDILHIGHFRFIPLFDHRGIIIIYAFFPWMGIMLTGYGIGKWFTGAFSATQRRKTLWISGSVLVLLFVVLRLINSYGDPTPWKPQRDAVFTFLSFLNVNKYPPSLMYTCMTLGPALILLALFDPLKPKPASFVTSFGRVPFFFYVLHIYLIHFAVVIVFLLKRLPAKDIAPQSLPFLFRPDNFGYSLSVIYLIWIAVILFMYPLCRWYSLYKMSRRSWWLSYL